MSSCFKRFAVAWVASVLVGVFSPAMHAQAPRTAKDGVYSDVQARRGQAVYNDRCAACHGATLGGDLAPPLAGNDFTAIWAGPLSDIVNKIQNTMPATEPGTLTRQQSADIVAYMLQVGKFPAGRAELSADEIVLKQIALAAAQTSPARQPTTASAQASVFPAAGNLNQVMRGILFPSSNLIFNVQTHDPGAPLPKRPANQPSDAAFSMVDWGAGIYKGWEIVDYAAVALAEAAPLMLTPGRRCENGRPVPVQDADWVKYTIELAEAGKAAYKASQTRKQDVVSDVTEQIANACLHCHQVYRDKRGGRNAADPANQAGRCVK
jgi:mono/diheme cytochrome c family protein